MRFASIGGSNAANYAGAGKAVADSAARMHKKQRETGPDYAGLSKVAMQTASNEKIAGMQAEAKLTNVAQKVYADQTQNAYKIKVFETKEKIKANQRKAGGIAAIGKIAAAGFLSASDNEKNRPYPKADRKGFDDAYQSDVQKLLSDTKAKRAAIHAESDATSKALRNKFDSSTFNSTNNAESDTSSDAKPSGVTPGKVTEESSVSPLSVPSSNTYQLSGNRKLVADAVAGPESGSWGYEAFNQGGGAEGTSVLGKSGSHKDVFGQSLTDMTLGEIFHRQNTKQRGLSMDEHMRSGGLHAVGRYQFIGSTLQDEARRMGLSLDTKFTPEVQDNIFFSHIKRVGNISPWVGPSTKWDQNKKNQINSLIPTL
jgi:hypothetical protein